MWISEFSRCVNLWVNVLRERSWNGAQLLTACVRNLVIPQATKYGTAVVKNRGTVTTESVIDS